MEAGWDRTQPAAVNRMLEVAGHVYDVSTANVAAAVTDGLAGVHVADAHVGAAIRPPAHEVVVALTPPVRCQGDSDRA